MLRRPRFFYSTWPLVGSRPPGRPSPLSGKGRQSLASGNMRFSVAWKPIRQSGCSVASLAALLVLVMRNALGSYQYEGRRTKVAIDAFTGLPTA
jgi:hypothetical protein